MFLLNFAITNHHLTYKCRWSLQAIIIVQMSDPLNLFIVEHDNGHHLVGGQHHLVCVGLENVGASSIGESHILPCDDHGKLRFKSHGACHRRVKISQNSFLQHFVLFGLKVHHSQVN